MKSIPRAPEEGELRAVRKSADASKFRVGERVPGTDWVMQRFLGAGGHGVVLEVRKGRHLRKAMKVLHPAVAGRASFESRFADEVQVLARLHHPNIVDVADCGVLADGFPFLLMELLQGRTLRAVVRQMPIPFTAAAVRQIAGEMCAGLGHAHGSHPPVVHRDIKPDNVFLHAPRPLESHVKLLDFGIAHVLDVTRSADPPVGTLRYAAPEVLDDGPIGAKADLYALAIVVYELLTQGFPWRVDFGSAEHLVEAHRRLEPLAPSRWKPWVPKSVDACLLRALSKNPDDRQRSVAEFDEELGELEVVNDGSAGFQMDAPTAPTVATMARGGLTPVSDVSRPSPVRHAERGGWLDAARSRLANAGVTRDAGDDTTRRPEDPRLGRRNPPGRATEGALIDATPAAAVPEGRPDQDTLPTGALAPPRKRPAGVVMTAVALGAGVLVAAAMRGGGKAPTAAPAIESAYAGGPPSATTPAWAAALEVGIAPHVLRDATPDSATPASALVEGGNSARKDPRRSSARGVPTPDALRQPSHPKPSGSAPLLSNLDDFLLAGPPPEDGDLDAGGPRSKASAPGSVPETTAAVSPGAGPHGGTTRPREALPSNLDSFLRAGPSPERAAVDGGGGSAAASLPRSVARDP
jgi:serine/threonine-protein kinase